MEIVAASFSIRGYAEGMRSIDLGRCWPFDYGSDARSPLPEIKIQRFRWWADELDAVRSTELVDLVIDQSKDNAEVANSEAEGEVDKGRRSVKGKQRTKKRSIVELFAASPLILGATDDDDDNEEVDDVMMRIGKEKCIKKKKKRKKKKKNNDLELICALEKEKLCKPKSTYSVQRFMLQNSECSKKKRLTAKRIAEIQKQSTKKSARKKNKASSSSILLSMKQEPAKKAPISILKKHKRGAKNQKSSKLISAEAANLIKLYCKSNRHVTFSVEDDLLGKSRACSAMDLPQLQNLCKIFSDVLAASSLHNSNQGHTLPDDNGMPKEVKAFEKGIETESIAAGMNQSIDSNADLCRPTIVNSSNSSCSGAEKASFAVMVDLNRAIDGNDSECFIPSTSTTSTSCVYDPKSASEIHMKANSMEVLQNHSFHASSSPSLIVYDNTNEGQFQSHANQNVNFCRQIGEHHSGGHCSPKDVLDSRYNSMMSSKHLKEHLLTPDKHHGEIIGLPLNSQGERIQLHSGAKFSEIYDRQSMDLCSSHGFSANRHEWNQKHCYNAKSKDSLLSCNPNLRSHSFNGYRNTAISNNLYEREDLYAKHIDGYHYHPTVPPTMRLMGKNVVVGEASRDASRFNNRRRYNNGQKLAERQSQFSQPWIQGEHASNSTLGRSNSDLLELLDSGPNAHHMKMLEPKLGYMNFSHQSQWSSGSHNQNLYQGPSSSTPSQFAYKMPFIQPATNPPQQLLSPKNQKRNQSSGINSMPPLSAPYVHPCKACGPFESNDKRSVTALKKDRDRDNKHTKFPSFKSSRDGQMLIKRPTGFHDGIMNSANRPLREQFVSLSPAKTKVIKHPIIRNKAPVVDNDFRSGPTKLIAGAKHILKPCHKGDEESCRLIHSTILSPNSDGAGKLFGSEKKIANIYYF